MSARLPSKSLFRFELGPTAPIIVKIPNEPLTAEEQAELEYLERHGRKSVVDFRRKAAARLRGPR